MVALAFENLTVLVPALKVPPTLFHALLPPFMVNCADEAEFKIPAASMVKVFISVTLGKVGEFSVVEASGMIIFLSDDGPAFGVQFSILVQESDTDPFHVSVDVVLYSSSVIFLFASQVDVK